MKLSANHVKPYMSRTLTLFCSIEVRSLSR